LVNKKKGPSTQESGAECKMCGRKFAPIKVFFGFCKECLRIKEDRRGAK